MSDLSAILRSATRPHTVNTLQRRFPRAAGILLHPTSLPGPGGVGDLGREAHRFVDFLAASGLGWWQVLPLNPTGVGNSPYGALSAFAGNPLLISLECLVEEGLLSGSEIAGGARLPVAQADYGAACAFRFPLLQRAFLRFNTEAGERARAEFEQFCDENANWLDDYALFMALKATRPDKDWTGWEENLAARRTQALATSRSELSSQVAAERFQQFLFFKQWSQLREYANRRQVRIIGDLPIFVAHDSVDVWANRNLFQVDAGGRARVVAGVPPDSYSPTGQRWGNPLYDWRCLAQAGYAWWIDRFRSVLRRVDAVRIDHFRGFAAYWEVPAEHKTAQYGKWKAGPGAALFEKVEAALGELPIIVEDLGVITPDVEALRDGFGYPGMKVLQFAFGDDASNPYLPHNYERHCVVYTATHDNDTTAGWFKSLPPQKRTAVLRYVGTSGKQIAWDLNRLAFASVADTAIVPMQDVLSLGSEARMNSPGKAEANWLWRCAPGVFTPQLSQRLRDLAMAYGRLAGTPARDTGATQETPSSDAADGTSRV